MAGVNTGIMLVRNDKDEGWSEEFWGDVARVSRINREVARGTDSRGGPHQGQALPADTALFLTTNAANSRTGPKLTCQLVRVLHVPGGATDAWRKGLAAAMTFPCAVLNQVSGGLMI